MSETRNGNSGSQQQPTPETTSGRSPTPSITLPGVRGESDREATRRMIFDWGLEEAERQLAEARAHFSQVIAAILGSY